MRPLTLDEVVPADAYEALRDEYRARVMALKRDRRLPVGDRLTLLFENRETIRFQVQEMLRIERIADPEKIQHELDVYNELIPGDAELSATLMIEITDLARIRPELDRLVGLDEQVLLVLGEGPDARRIRARFDDKQLEADRIAAVHYLKFALAPGDADRLRDRSVPAQLRIEHPNYRVDAALPATLRHALLGDLGGDPEPLLRKPDGSPGGEEPLAESGRVRVVRPLHPAGLGHVIVEPGAPVPTLLDADAELMAELMARVQECAREIHARHGRCRVLCDLHGPRLRWHVFAPTS